MQALARVERGVVAGHRLALPQRALARREVVVVGRGGRRQRGVDEAQRGRLELGVAAGMDAVGGLVEGDRVVAAAFEVDDAQLQAAGDALGDGQVAREDLDVVEHDVVARGDQLARRGEIGHGRIDRDEAEVAAGVVDAHVEAAGAVLEVVLDVGAAREDGAPSSRAGGIGIGIGVGDRHRERATRSSPCSRSPAAASARRASSRRRCRTARRFPRRRACRPPARRRRGARAGSSAWSRPSSCTRACGCRWPSSPTRPARPTSRRPGRRRAT